MAYNKIFYFINFILAFVVARMFFNTVFHESKIFYKNKKRFIDYVSKKDLHETIKAIKKAQSKHKAT